MAGKVAIRSVPALAALLLALLPSADAVAQNTGSQPQTIEVLGVNGEARITTDPSLAYGATTSYLPVSFSASGACVAGESYLYQQFPPDFAFPSDAGPIIWGPAVYAAPIDLLRLGTCTVVASQPGDDTYAPASDVSYAFEVVPPVIQTFVTRAPTRQRTPKSPPRRRLHRWVLEFGSDPAATSYSCSLDQAAFTPCSSPAVFRKLAPGIHRFRVESFVRDVASGTPASLRFRVPGRAPRKQSSS
jgi:hypothetical protein